MQGEGRKVLGQAYADIAAENAGLIHTDELELLRNKQEQKAYRAPVVIAVAVIPTAESKAPWIEEIAAVHAAVQNMLLTAHALGLGAIWRSGEPMYHNTMNAAFGLKGDEQLVGLIYMGYPDPDLKVPHVQRTSSAHKTIWLN